MLKPIIRVHAPDLSDAADHSGPWCGIASSVSQVGQEWRVQFASSTTLKESVSVGLSLQWPDANNPWVCLPGAVYAGNDFRSQPFPYPCIISDPADFRADLPNTVSNIPRLPRIQLLAGDCSMPAVGLADFTQGKGVWLLTDPLANGSQPLLEVTTHAGLSASILAPGVRFPLRYFGCGEKWVPSEDRGWRPNAGELVAVRVRVVEVNAEGSHDMHHALWEHRHSIWRSGGRLDLPWSAAFDLIEAKYAGSNWDPERRYYAVGDRQSRYAHWQMGWVGGGIASHALLVAGSHDSQQKALDSLSFIVSRGQSPSGFFWSVGIEDEMFSDMVDMDWGHDWHLVRRSGDALYFLSKQLLAAPVEPPGLRESIEKCAAAFVKLWKAEGQFGQFVSQETGEIRVGSTASAAIAPAGLALAARVLAYPSLLEVAQESAQYFLRHFLDKGFTSGGPGEAAQCPDSESAFGLLESLVTLYEETGDETWLLLAEKAAWHAASWVMPYDFQFPEASTFGQLGMATTGSVWANAQNKHSAPGICTLSGASLFRLARATGKHAFLDLLKEISQGITQYLSRADRPVFGMPPGWMCERVNTSDWEHPITPVGEGFAASCWCEASTLLTFAEVPGLYVVSDLREWTVLDHVLAIEQEADGSDLTLRVHNPSQWSMRLTVWSETAADRSVPLGQDFLRRAESVPLKPGEARILRFGRASGKLRQDG